MHAHCLEGKVTNVNVQCVDQYHLQFKKKQSVTWGQCKCLVCSLDTRSTHLSRPWWSDLTAASQTFFVMVQVVNDNDSRGSWPVPIPAIFQQCLVLKMVLPEITDCIVWDKSPALLSPPEWRCVWPMKSPQKYKHQVHVAHCLYSGFIHSQRCIVVPPLLSPEVHITRKPSFLKLCDQSEFIILN